MTVCEDLMEERKMLWNATRLLSAARADVSHLKEELENHKLYYCNPGNFRKRLIFVLFVNSWNLLKLIAY